MATIKTSLGSMDDDWSRASRRMIEAMKPALEIQKMMNTLNSGWIKQIQDIQRAMLPSLAIDTLVRQQTYQIQSIVNTALYNQARILSDGIVNVLNSTMINYQFKISDRLTNAIRQMTQIGELINIPKVSFMVLEMRFNFDANNAIAAAIKQLSIDMSPLAKAFRNIKPLDFKMIDWDGLKSLRTFPDDDIQINPDGTVSVSGVLSDVREVTDAINQCLKESSQLDVVEALQRRNIREIIINHLINIAKSLISLKSGKIVALFIFGIIVDILVQNTLCPLVKPYTDGLNTYIEKTITRAIKKEASTIATLDRNSLKGFRFVTKSRLLVRAGNCKKSRVIGELTLGQVVQVIHKNKNWTKIQYIDPVTDECINGWVLTRYISAFK